MKKLIIVGTKVNKGKGGIATALLGYMEGLKAKGVDFEVVESHVEERNMFLQWFLAFWTVAKLAIRYRKDAVFWFHCGPWLSSLRKFSLAVVARLFGAKALGHIHSPTFEHYINGGRVKALFIKVMVSPYSTLVVLTPWWEQLIRESGIKTPVVVSPNPNNQLSCDMARKYLAEPRNIDKFLEIPDDSGMIKSGEIPDDSGATTREHKTIFNCHPRAGGDLKQPNAIVNILSMARMVEGKGIEATIEAMSYLPDYYQLTIAGDGNKLEAFKELAASSAAKERILFTGWIDGEQKNDLLNQADVFCVPSTYDSFGMVFIEAMAYDLPVVAYGWGPIKDVVNSRVGVCCDEVSGENVANNILHVIGKKSDYSGLGPQEVLSKYTPEQVAENIIRLL